VFNDNSKHNTMFYCLERVQSRTSTKKVRAQSLKTCIFPKVMRSSYTLKTLVLFLFILGVSYFIMIHVDRDSNTTTLMASSIPTHVNLLIGMLLTSSFFQ